MKKRNFPLYKIFVYVALITLAISIIVPIVWVFLASLKSQLELVSGNPFDLPKQILWSNFADAFVKARMGDYLLNTIIVTALSFYWWWLFLHRMFWHDLILQERNSLMDFSWLDFL